MMSATLTAWLLLAAAVTQRCPGHHLTLADLRPVAAAIAAPLAGRVVSPALLDTLQGSLDAAAVVLCADPVTDPPHVGQCVP